MIKSLSKGGRGPGEGGKNPLKMVVRIKRSEIELIYESPLTPAAVGIHSIAL